jgi:hypothetical protein
MAFRIDRCFGVYGCLLSHSASASGARILVIRRPLFSGGSTFGFLVFVPLYFYPRNNSPRKSADVGLLSLHFYPRNNSPRKSADVGLLSLLIFFYHFTTLSLKKILYCSESPGIYLPGVVQL